MIDIKLQISEWINVEQNNLNEISLEDVEFEESIQQNINNTVLEMLSIKDQLIQSADQLMSHNDGVTCKSFWVENSKALILYIWTDNQSKAIIVPQDSWMIRNDITLH